VWGRGYTELFFLDEITALAAGHRPCFECRRAEAEAFRACFGGGRLSAPQMDAILHEERLDAAGKRVWQSSFDLLPDGAMVAWEGGAHAICGDMLSPWSFEGYGPPRRRPGGEIAWVLTPRSIVGAIRAGYQPRRSANPCLTR
jgi:hypothetical protein